MYKIIIADDEVIEINAFRVMINKDFGNLQLVAEATNGIEAVEMAKRFEPDIMIMDIKMPGIDGLTAILEIKKLVPKVKFIVLTAFSSFEYAQQALKMGVEDYLLKPVKMQKIIETLNNVINKIENEGKRNEKEIELQDKIDEIKPFVERDIISAIITGGNTSNIIKKYAKFLEMNLACSFCIVLYITSNSKCELGDLRDLISKQKASDLIRQKVKEVCRCLISDIFNDYILLLIPVETDSDKYKNRLWAIDLANYIENKVNFESNLTIKFGIGEVYNGYENIRNSYIEALGSIKYSDDKNFIVHFGDIKNENNLTKNIYPYDLEKKLCEKIVTGQDKSCKILAESLIDKVIEMYRNDLEVIKAKTYEVMVVIHRYIDENMHDESCINMINMYQEINCIKDVASLKDWIVNRVAFLNNNLMNKRQGKLNNDISCAINFINDNINKELTLEEVASKIGISPYYLSKLFKKKLDKNFIDYISELRIERAKDLLKNTDMSIKEITYEVGYNSQTYFSKVFKKITGISAGDFKNKF